MSNHNSLILFWKKIIKRDLLNFINHLLLKYKDTNLSWSNILICIGYKRIRNKNANFVLKINFTQDYYSLWVLLNFDASFFQLVRIKVAVNQLHIIKLPAGKPSQIPWILKSALNARI